MTWKVSQFKELYIGVTNAEIGEQFFVGTTNIIPAASFGSASTNSTGSLCSVPFALHHRFRTVSNACQQSIPDRVSHAVVKAVATAAAIWLWTMSAGASPFIGFQFKPPPSPFPPLPLTMESCLRLLSSIAMALTVELYILRIHAE